MAGLITMEPQSKSLARAHYCVFDTAIGPCGVAWSEGGLTRLQLPESSRSATEKRLRAASAGPAAPDDPPPAIVQLITDIQRYLTGARVEFFAARIDLTGTSPFDRQVYEAARTIGWGQTASYGELARRIGSPDAARFVGQALSRNPIPVVIPCHRILAAGHRVGGFSAFGGTAAKTRLLALEGVHVSGDAPRLPGL